MNELLVLSLLMHWPLHAYKIATIANNILGPEEEISRGTLSTLLTKLEQARLIVEADATMTPFPSRRQTRVLSITPAGRGRFLELMLDTTTSQGSYRKIFSIKALHLEFLPLEQQLYLVEHYLAYCRHLLQDKQEQRTSHAGDRNKQEKISSAFRQATQQLMQRKIDQLQADLVWAEALRGRIITELRQVAETT
jgi:DNA-binding PadR family transcriptional regulator